MSNFGVGGVEVEVGVGVKGGFKEEGGGVFGLGLGFVDLVVVRVDRVYEAKGFAVVLFEPVFWVGGVRFGAG
jgi:hypothetical protein